MWPTLISAVALIVSIISIVVGFRRQKTQLQITVRDQLSGIIQEVTKSLVDNDELQSTPANERNARFLARNASIQRKLATLCRQAAALIQQADKIVFDVEFEVLAQAMEIVGDFPQSDSYWKQAVKAAPTDYYSIITKRGYGAFLLRQGEQQQGRALFEEALSIWGNTTDFCKFTNGWTYQYWANAEWWNSPGRGRAAELFREAKNLYETISSPLLKADALQRLENAHPNATAGSSDQNT